MTTENDSLIAITAQGVAPDELFAGNIYGYKLPDRVEVVDLSDKNLDRPRRKTGTVVVEDFPSFAVYYGKHADPNSETYVNVDGGIITAVLNAHGETEGDDPDYSARWQDHRVRLHLKHTDAWTRWIGIDRKLLPQEDFANFIDDNRGDIRTPAAADMLELVQQFQAIQKVTFQSATILSNGDRRLTYIEETEGSGGGKHQITVPSTLELGIAPYQTSEPYAVQARFRYRIDRGALKMGVILDNADDVRRDAVKGVVEQIETELGIKVMRGTPA